MAGPSGKPQQTEPKLRLDKWLYQARFFKTRLEAMDFLVAGHLRVNGNGVTKAGATAGVGDVLTFPHGGRIRVIRVMALGTRRGPATEARTLYDDLDQDLSDPASSPLE